MLAYEQVLSGWYGLLPLTPASSNVTITPGLKGSEH